MVLPEHTGIRSVSGDGIVMVVATIGLVEVGVVSGGWWCTPVEQSLLLLHRVVGAVLGGESESLISVCHFWKSLTTTMY